jgi:hypothetical protein
MTDTFLHKIFEDKLPQEYIQINTKEGDDSSTWNSEYFLTVEEANEYVDSVKDYLNVYFGVAPRIKEAGDASSINRTFFVWQDIDTKGRAVDVDLRLRRFKARYALPPSYIINSGHGLHLYWRIKPEKILKIAKQTLQVLTARTGGDTALNAITGVLRVPDTYNYKKEGSKEPVYIVENNDFFTYTLDDINKATQLDNSTNKIIFTGDAEDFEGDRSLRDFHVISEMMKVGLPEATIRYVFNSTEIGDRLREDLETKTRRNGDYFDITIANVRESGIISTGDADNRWNIFEENFCYLYFRGKGKKEQISTFIFDPEKLLEGDLSKKEEDTIIGTIRTHNKSWSNISFTRTAFNGAQNLHRQLPKSEWQWLGTDMHVRKLLPYLIEKLTEKGGGELPSQQATPIIGRHGEYFVAPKVTIGGNEQLVWLPTQKEHPNIHYKRGEHVKQTLQTFVDNYFYINEHHIVWGALGWFVAALFKPELEKQRVRFPTLNLFGTRGSGKTTLIHELQKMVGYIQPTTYDANTTQFVMLALFSSTNAIPISISEYRRSEGSGDLLSRRIRLAYDTGYDSRGRADQTTVQYPLCAPITVDGEDPITDSATVERSIQLNLRPETIAEKSDCYQHYMNIRNLKNINEVATELILWSLSYEADYEELFDLTFELVPEVIPDRVRRNITVVLWGIRGFANFCNSHGVTLEEPDYQAIIYALLDELVNVSSGRTRLLVDDYVQEIINSAMVEANMGRFPFAWTSKPGFFYFQFSSAYDYWVEKRNRKRQQIMEETSIRKMLEERFNDYVVPPKSMYMGVNFPTTRAYGIDLGRAIECGLDVPSTMKASVKDDV